MISKSTYALLFNSNVGSAALVAALDFVAVVCSGHLTPAQLPIDTGALQTQVIPKQIQSAFQISPKVRRNVGVT